jgi:hypothetical protein
MQEAQGRTPGSYTAWPHACARSEHFKQRSVHAKALLFEFVSQYNGNNNGDLCCAFKLLKARGWKSRTTIEKARAGVYRDRATVCISSQAGCAMGCTFCATGQAGFDRHLGVGEICEQVLRAQHDSPQRVANVVYMGMGEPLANLGAVAESLRILNDDHGLNLGARRITVSTSGLVPQIRELASLDLQVGLAVSLHATTDELRDEGIVERLEFFPEGPRAHNTHHKFVT